MLDFNQVNPEHCISCFSPLVMCVADREDYYEPEYGDCVEPAKFECQDCGEEFDEQEWQERSNDCASGPDRIEAGEWYCSHCDREFNLDDLDRSGEPCEVDHPRPDGWHRGALAVLAAVALSFFQSAMDLDHLPGGLRPQASASVEEVLS